MPKYSSSITISSVFLLVGLLSSLRHKLKVKTQAATNCWCEHWLKRRKNLSTVWRGCHWRVATRNIDWTRRVALRVHRRRNETVAFMPQDRGLITAVVIVSMELCTLEMMLVDIALPIWTWWKLEATWLRWDAGANVGRDTACGERRQRLAGAGQGDGTLCIVGLEMKTQRTCILQYNQVKRVWAKWVCLDRALDIWKESETLFCYKWLRPSLLKAHLVILLEICFAWN